MARPLFERGAPDHGGVCTVDSPPAVDLLLNLKATRMLAPFLHTEHTLSSAASTVAVAPSTMAYWIPRFVRNGLLVRTRVEQRGGAPMPWYRAQAPTFFIPIGAVPERVRFAFLERGRSRVIELFDDALDDLMASGPLAGVTVRGSGPRGVDIEFAPPPIGSGHDPWTEFWGVLQLAPEDAESFAREIGDLVRTYRDREGRGVEVVVHAGVIAAAKRRRRR